MINWMKYRFIYFAISGIVIAAGVFGLLKWGLKIGVDFKGGSIIEYQIQGDFSKDKLIEEMDKVHISINSIQKEKTNVYLFRAPTLTNDQKITVTEGIKKLTGKEVVELRFESVGPALGPELIRKTIVALLISAGAILLWVAYQFKSIKFGTSAVLAMFHDSLVVIGTFSLLGHFFGAEIDFLFVTALLTILSFSVHDTIVVYDRVREKQHKEGGNILDLANSALSETMVRSLNNSFTIIFMLVALVLLGGDTIRWFSVALLIGTISGTYSSPFVAIPILVTWDQIEKKIKKLS